MTRSKLNFNFDEVLVTYLKNKEVREHKIGIYGASEVSMCNRKLYFIYKEKTKRAGIDSMRIFEMGHVIHDFVEEMMPTYPGYISSEDEITKEYDGFKIVGHYDALIHDGEELAIIDFKTTKRIPSKPYDSHIIQVNTYLHLCGLKRGYITYIEKNTFLTKTFFVASDDMDFERILVKMKDLHVSLMEDKIPEMDESHLCNYCEYKKECFEIQRT